MTVSGESPSVHASQPDSARSTNVTERGRSAGSAPSRGLGAVVPSAAVHTPRPGARASSFPQPEAGVPFRSGPGPELRVTHWQAPPGPGPGPGPGPRHHQLAAQWRPCRLGCPGLGPGHAGRRIPQCAPGRQLHPARTSRAHHASMLPVRQWHQPRTRRRARPAGGLQV